MSSVKDKKHNLYYEGKYWSSEAAYREAKKTERGQWEEAVKGISQGILSELAKSA